MYTNLPRYVEALGSDRIDDYIWRFELPEGKYDVCNYGPLSTHPVGLQWYAHAYAHAQGGSGSFGGRC